MPTPSRAPVFRRTPLLILWALIAAAPVAYVAVQAIAASRNIAFWDEIDTALDLILRIDAGAGWSELFQRFVAVNNEHRMATSRLLYAMSYWFTGTVNFHVIGAIGNLFLVGACATLVWGVHGVERRMRMAVILAFLMFQLEHFESFIWSGSSVDHFQVVMLAMLAIAALARGTPGATAAAAGFGVLATFTLAQGNCVWPAGALLLAHQQRVKELAAWTACGIATVAAFLHGFELNPHNQIEGLSVARVLGNAHYWLRLLGAPLTLGEARWAPLPGVVLLAALAFAHARGMTTRQPVAMFGAVFAVGGLALIALGRTELAGTAVNSRYLVLGALAWALTIFMLIESETGAGADAGPARPFRRLAWIAPALVAFNVAANAKFAPAIESFSEVRDRAATSFRQFGADGKGVTKFRLHPKEGHAEVLLKRAEERGVYRLPEFSLPAAFPAPVPNEKIVTYVDEFLVNDRSVMIGGWAMAPGLVSRRGQVYVVLRSAQSQLFFSSVTLPRVDVAAAYKEPKWRLSGFRAVIMQSQLPAEDFDVGVLIADGGRAEFLMTKNKLLLASGREETVVHAKITP